MRDLKRAIATLAPSDAEEQEVREPSRFRYDAQKALSKHRIRGPMDFGPIFDAVAVSKLFAFNTCLNL